MTESINRFAGRLLAMLLLGWLAAAVYFQHDIGLADQGDFIRLTVCCTSAPVGFDAKWPEANAPNYWQRFGRYWLPYWKLDWPDLPPFIRSSTALLILPGVIVNQGFFSTSVLHSAALGFFPRLLLAGLVLALLWGLARSGYRGWSLLYLTIGLPAALIFTADDYVAFFNSFYQETGSFVYLFLFLAALVYVKYARWLWWAVLLSLAALFCLTAAKSSTLYWPVIGVPALLGMVFWARPRQQAAAAGEAAAAPRRPTSRRLLIALAWSAGLFLFAAVVIVGFIRGARSIVAINTFEPRTNPYNSYFDGALLFSKRPVEHLAKAGMADMLPMVGTQWYTPGVPERIAPHSDKITFRRTLDVFRDEPQVLFRMLHCVTREMQQTSLVALGRYAAHDPRAAAPGEPAARPMLTNLWSGLRSRYFPTGNRLLIGLAASMAWFAWGLLRRRGLEQDLCVVGLLAAGACLADMLVAVVGDGRAALDKHLFLANVLCDVACVALINSALLAAHRWLPAIGRRLTAIRGRR